MIEILIVITFLLLIYVVRNERYKKRLEEELDGVHNDLDILFEELNKVIVVDINEIQK